MAAFEIKDGVCIIPSGVTEIPDGAFEECTSLQIIEIPNGVRKIGFDAFMDVVI